jgi:hypothetical protein
MIVTTMWGMRRSNAIFSILGMTNKIPISTSQAPKSIIKVWKDINGSVSFSKFSTRGLAGLISKNFKEPNHTKTTKSAK